MRGAVPGHKVRALRAEQALYRVLQRRCWEVGVQAREGGTEAGVESGLRELGALRSGLAGRNRLAVDRGPPGGLKPLEGGLFDCRFGELSHSLAPHSIEMGSAHRLSS